MAMNQMYYQGAIIIPEEHLADVGKNIQTLLIDHNCDHMIENLIASLLKTSRDACISQKHRNAACNSLHLVLQKCMNSSKITNQQLPCSQRVVSAVLDLYLERYNTAKGKLMKQVLITLVKILRQTTLILHEDKLTQQVIYQLFDALFIGDNRVKAKPALHALTIFLVRSVVKSNKLIDLYRTWSMNQVGNGSRDSTTRDTMQCLLNSILRWIACSEVAPTAGPLLAVLLDSAVKEQGELANIINATNRQEPIWAKPILESLNGNRVQIESFSTYAFPNLFKHDIADYWLFLKTLGPYCGFTDGKYIDQTWLNKISLSRTMRQTIFTLSLQVGKKIGMVEVVDSHRVTTISLQDKAVHVPVSYLQPLLASSVPSIRLAGLTLLISSPQISRAISKTALSSLQNMIPLFFCEVDANFRSEVLSLMQNLLERLRGILIALARTSQQTMPGNEPWNKEFLLESYKDHQDFLHWLRDFLIAELHPCASYQRHISALKTITMLLHCGVSNKVLDPQLLQRTKIDNWWPFTMQIIGPQTLRIIYDLLLDPYEDIRQEALLILQTSMTNVKSEHLLYDVSSVLQRAEVLMIQSGRADYADGVGRIYHLLASCCDATSTHSQIVASSNDVKLPKNGSDYWRLVICLADLIESSVHAAEKSIRLVVSKHSLHGLFVSLRYVLGSLLNIQDPDIIPAGDVKSLVWRLFSIITIVWTLVRDVLCEDAVGDIVDKEPDEDVTSNTQDTLSFAWRALKESSLLLRQLVTIFLQLQTSSTEAHQFLQTAGDLCFEQLSELRHRGAFSTVSQTHAAICRQCGLHSDAKINALLVVWYERTLSLIISKDSLVTRRSGGIPALIVGLVSVNTETTLFDTAIVDLTNIAQPSSTSETKPTEVARVHSLNTLKALFTTGRLGTESSPHVTAAISVAGNCLESESWAIRNCGLMLFRGLLDRLIGSENTLSSTPDTSNKSSLISWDDYVGLPDLLLRFLDRPKMRSVHDSLDSNGHQESNIGAEAIFLVLDLLRRTSPPPAIINELRNKTYQACCNPHWHVRDLGARTFAALTSTDEALSMIDFEVAKVYLPIDDNKIHGSLLCLKYVVRTAFLDSKISDLQDIAAKAFNSLVDMYNLVFSKFSRPPLQAAFIDALNTFGRCVLLCGKVRELQNVIYDYVELSYAILNLPSSRSFFENRRPYQDRAAMLERVLRLHALISGALILESEMNIKQTPIELNLFTLAFTNSSSDLIESLEEDFQSILVKLGIKTWIALAEGMAKLCATSLSSLCLRAQACDIVSNSIRRFGHDDSWTRSSRLQSFLAELDISFNFWQSHSPSSAETYLRVWGISIEAKYRSHGQWTDALRDEIKLWLQVIRKTLQNSSEFSMRHSAALSLQGLDLAIFSESDLPTSLQVQYAITVYDTLVDDDDEIRTTGSAAVQRLLSRSKRKQNNTKTLAAPIAAQMLCWFLVKNFPRSQELVGEAISRIVPRSPNMEPQFLVTRDTLEDASKADFTLFAVEKQNLYVDEVKEAYIWCRVLKNLSTGAIPFSLLKKFHNWVLDGLTVLAEKSREDHDGALGWASNPTIFALGMKLIFAAETLLDMPRRSRCNIIRGSTIRRKLAELVQVGEQNDLHGSWLSQVDRVLRKSVLQRLRQVRLGMHKIKP